MNIVVLTGGISVERDVSISTGTKVYKAIKAMGHKAVMLDVYFGCDHAEFGIDGIFENNDDHCHESGAIGKLIPDIAKIKNLRGNRDEFIGRNVIKICRAADIVFMALHGENGENGKLQAAFDLFGVKYTGAGSLGSAVAMNKKVSKCILKGNQIQTPEGIFLRTANAKEFDFTQVKLPCVIKPCSGGSSVGVSIAYTPAEMAKALMEAFACENEILLEDYIKGREFSVAVLGDAALPVIEIIPKQGFYDYVNKYQPGLTEEICPARLEADLTEKMQKMALAVHRALGLEVYSRIDFMLDEQEEIYCLEANTLPGMTPTSLIPQEAAAVGISYEDLCEKIIRLSFEKYKDGGY